MPPQPPRPPRLARWLLSAAAPAAERPFVRQELDDEFQRLASVGPVDAARRWYWRQTAASIGPLARARVTMTPDPRIPRRSLPMTMSIGTDLRHTLRRWARAPGTVLTAVLTLALGIGATTAIFSVVDAVLLTPLPWREPDRLVSVTVARPHWRDDPTLSASWDRGQLSWPIYKDLQTKSRSLDDVGVYGPTRVAFGDADREVVDALRVSSGLFPMLGVLPVRGRFFTPDEDDTETRAVLISEDAWHRRFGGAPDVVGRSIAVLEGRRVVVGIVPAGVELIAGRRPEIYLPWGIWDAHHKTPGNHFLSAIARLAPGVTIDAALADVDPLVRGESPAAEKGGRLRWLHDVQVGSSRRPLWMLFAAAGVLLLIACTNVAGLLLAQAESRRHDLAVRAALGGSRQRLASELLIESVTLGLVAAAAGLALAAASTPALVAMAPTQLPRIASVSLDLRVTAFAVVVSAGTSLLFGLVPALSLGAVSPMGALRDAGRTPGLHRSRLHGVIVAGQVALALILLVGASVLAQTLGRLTSTPVGFDASHVALISGQWPAEQLSDEATSARTDAVVAALAAVPGVEAAAGSHVPPFSGFFGSNSIQIEGRPSDRDPTAARQMVTADYFDTMRIPVEKGRAFGVEDRPGDFVAVVSREFERVYFDGAALGRRFILNGDPHAVIGVVPDVKQRGYAEPVTPTFYGLHRQQPGWQVSSYLVRTTDDPAAQLPRLRDALRQHAPGFAIQTTSTMAALMQDAVAQERYRTTLALVFGGVALALACVGLYGLVSRGVSDRRREIGLRLALGARQGQVRRFVIAQGARLVAAGLVVGIPMALMVSRAMTSLLPDVDPVSPRTLGGVIGVVALAALAASVVPARRASGTSPLDALRD